jgi:hypothetical protein
VIRLPCRVRGASAIGASGPGTVGPFGRWPDPDDLDEDDDQDDGEQQAEVGAARVTATDNGEEVSGGRVRYGCR